VDASGARRAGGLRRGKPLMLLGVMAAKKDVGRLVLLPV
jgi:hypothetical protein